MPSIEEILTTSPDLLTRLQAAESASSLDPTDPAVLDLLRQAAAVLSASPAPSSSPSKPKSLKPSKLKKSRSGPSKADTVRRALFKELVSQCVPLKIGGRDGEHPSDLDIRIESDPTSDRQIAWIPVPIWPVPIQPSDPSHRFFTRTNPTTGQTYTTANFDLGRVSIVDSLAEALVCTTTLHDPKNPELGFRKTRVALKAFATISLHPQSPAEIESRLARQSLHSERAHLVEPDDDLTSPVFIPSSTPTPSRESRTDTTPSSPFDSEGNTH